MSMSLGGGPQKAQINVTPLIDVLLVLIIIFLVITPASEVGLKALVPQSPAPAQQAPPPIHDIVVTVQGGGAFLLNQEHLDLESLGLRLKQLFKNGADDVIFVRAEKSIEFQQVAQVIDLARGAGVYRVALMTN